MDPLLAVRSALRGDFDPALGWNKPRGEAVEYAAWRFVEACKQTPTFGADHAVLLRQFLRWLGGNFLVGDLPDPFVESCAHAGIDISASGIASATPFIPAWLTDDFIDAHRGLDGRPVHRRPDESVPSEPYLKAIGYPSWQSQAQKEAAWATIRAPRGSTTLVALPTGSGKSLCFQLLSRFGTGLTVVVVPTIALAIDQWRSAKNQLSIIPDVNPRYFASGDLAADPDSVVRDIREGRTRLVFTSPEACVSGRLRRVLADCAKTGTLENLVVDEAHIIETWGVYFRVDFQMLASVQRQWLQLSEGRLRTFLLSATFTPRSTTVLSGLFGQGGEWREFVSQRLRPELTYYAHRFTSDESRLAGLLECVWRMPRPAIVFTTEVEEAKQFARTLTEEHGFARVGCFHGDTPPVERRRLLADWRADHIDLMVATSAFGLGVDKPDVRSIIHACFPENLHRYYQEAGRGGRDGASAECLLLPTSGDRGVAEGLMPSLLGDELAAARWQALWQSARRADDSGQLWTLITNARHTGLLGTRTWRQNVLWNKRLLLQLARSGVLELHDISYGQTSDDADPEESVTVKIGFTPTPNRVIDIIQPQRRADNEQWKKGIDQIEQYLNGQQPLCRLLKRLYGKKTQLTCGGCPACRVDRRPDGSVPSLDIGSDRETQPDVEVVFGIPDPRDPGGAIKMRSLLYEILAGKQVTRLVCWYEHQNMFINALSGAIDDFFTKAYRLDTFGNDSPFLVEENDHLAVFHVGVVAPDGLALRKGRRITHFFCGCETLDLNGHFPLEAEGARPYPAVEMWLSGA